MRSLQALSSAIFLLILTGGAHAQTVAAGHPPKVLGRPGDDFVEILRVRVSNPAPATLTSFSVGSLNTADTDAAVVSCYFTGSSPGFATTTPFGDVNGTFNGSTGTRSPGNVADPGAKWTNEAFAMADGGGAATATAKLSVLELGGFGIAIPAGSRIHGVVVQTDAWNPTGTTSTIGVALSPDGGATWTADQDSATLPATETTQTFGGALDPDFWGRPWTPAELSDATFKVRLTTKATGGGGNDWTVDWVRVTVTYVSSASGGTATFTGSQALPAGDSYFHVVYAVAEGATVGNVLDARIPANGLTLGGSPVPAAEVSPAPESHVLPGNGVLFFDTLEGAVAGWTSTVQRDLCSAPPHPWAIATPQAVSPTKSFFHQNLSCFSGGGECNANTQPANQKGLSNGEWMLDSPSIAVASGTTNLSLTFWHKVNVETAFDGGFLRYELNGSGTWLEIPGTRIRRNPYNNFLNFSAASVPDPGHPAWNGDLFQGRFVKVTVDLSGLGLEGNAFRVRWMSEQDDCSSFEGWFVDDVTVRGFPKCLEPLGDAGDLNDTRIASRVCALRPGHASNGLQTNGSDTTDFWSWDVARASTHKVTMTITSVAQFDLFLYRNDGSLAASDAPGLVGLPGPGATRMVSAALTPGLYFVEARYVSGTSTYSLVAEDIVPLESNVHGLRAEPLDQAIRISWEVDAPSDAVSFQVVRDDGEKVIGPIEVDSLPASFAVEDADVTCGHEYGYTLEETSATGTVTSIGSVRATPCANGAGPACACDSVVDGGAFAGLLLAGAFGLVFARRRSR